MSRLLAVFMVFLLAAPSLAQPRARFRLPEGTRGDNVHCYNFGEYQQLLEMDVDLEYYFQVYQATTRLLQLRTEQFSEATQQVTTLTSEVTRLRIAWEEENRLRHEAENRPSVSAYVGWAVAIVGVILAGAFGISLALK